MPPRWNEHWGPLLLSLELLTTSCARPVSSPPASHPGATPADWAAACKDWDEWDQPGPAFRIHGSSYYVGTCGISAILVAGEQGHVLIDSGTDEGARVVAANIERLGFRLSDVKVLLHSHEHHDHVGGMARLQQLTGARLIASPQAASALATGQATPDDPQAGMNPPFPPARVDQTLGEELTVRLGDLALSALVTPGHTPGALSWTWQSCEGTSCVQIVYADSLSPVSSDSYRFTQHPAYLASFRAGLARLRETPCDLLLTPHPSASEMRERLLERRLGSRPGACREYAASISQRLDTRLAKEASGVTP